MDSGTFERVSSENMVTSDGRTFTPGGHKSSGHGIIFHEQYLLLCAYRSLAFDNTFSITCEFEEAGKFDDLVYFHKVNGAEVCEMIQYKHVASTKKVLNLSELVSTSNSGKSYSLVVYFNSYLELYYSKQNNFVPFEQKYDCKINSCILMTNRGLDVGFVKANLDDCTTETRLFCTGKSYRFKADGRDRTMIEKEILEKSATKGFRLDSSLIRSRIDEFLDKFVLSVENKREIEAEIKKEIETCLRNQNVSDEKIIDGRIEVLYMCLSIEIFLFHSNNEVFEATNDVFERWLSDDNRKIGENVVSVHHECNMDILRVFGTNLFTEDSVKKLKDFVDDRQENIFCVVGRGRTIFALLKLVQVLEIIGKSFRVILDNQFLSLSDEQATVNEYLIVRCESREKWNGVVEKATLLLGHNAEKKIALVTDFDLRRTRDETLWPDLVEDAKLRLDSKSILFQGRRVPFSVLDVSGVETHIDELVLDGIFQNSLNISRRFDDEKSEEIYYFIDRRIGRRNRIDLESFRGTDHMFVVENMTEREYEGFVAEQRFDRKRLQLLGERGFDVFCEENRNKNISLLYHVGGTFYWKKSCGESIEESTDKGSDAVIDLEDVSRITDQTVLIVAEPGMGKSNLLFILLERSVDERPDVWIVKIDLSSHTKCFYEMQEKQEHFRKESAIEFVVESQELETKSQEFESSLFRSYFDLEGKLIVLLDGFDEIAPDYRETVLELIDHLSSISKIRVWLTSRPQEKDYLETRLGLMSYSMLEFTDEDQKEFFTRFWTRSDDVVDARVRDFIDQLLRIADESFRNTRRLLTGIPLQCRMLGEIYRSRFEEYSRTENGDPELPYELDILDLYEEFVRKIFERHVVEKTKIDPTKLPLRNMIEQGKEKLNKSHRLLSLEIIFPQRLEATHRVKLEKYKKCIIDGKERTGIVHSLDLDRRPVFLHRTFAEYFSALRFYDELKASNRETKRDLIDYLERDMFQPQYEVFREFFDRLSVRCDPVLRHVLNGDIDSLEQDPDLEIVSRVDDFSRNALHLAASYKHKATIGFLIGKGVRVDSRDRLFDWTPLKYGISGRVLISSHNSFRNGLDYDSIVSLLPGNEDDRTMYERITDRNKLLLYASQYGRGELVDYLLKRGVDADVSDYYGCSPLHYAAENGHDGVCATLIKYKASVDCRDGRGWTPLHCAFDERHTSTVALLLDRGADINAKKGNKETPVHVFRNESLIARIIDCGADVKTKNSENFMPLHIACDRGHDAITVVPNAEKLAKNRENLVTKCRTFLCPIC